MSKHTPGPWEYVGGNDFCVEINLPNDNIVSIDRGQRYSDAYVMSRDELEANGRLIAAAPEMLELLEDILNEVTLPSDISGDLKRLITRINPTT